MNPLYSPLAREAQEYEMEEMQEYAESRGFDEDLAHYDIPFFKRKQRASALGSVDPLILIFKVDRNGFICYSFQDKR